MRKHDSKLKIPYFRRALIALFFSAVFFFSPAFAHAADLYFAPPSGSYKAGTTFSVVVFVSTGSQSANAVSGTILFPTDTLEAVSISKTGSVISYWSAEPSFSNSQGTVSFEGVAFNPGYTGPAGRILSIIFKVKNAGSANLSFSSGSVLANDGQGTEIVSSLGQANFSLTPATAPLPQVKNNPPPAPVVPPPASATPPPEQGVIEVSPPAPISAPAPAIAVSIPDLTPFYFSPLFIVLFFLVLLIIIGYLWHKYYTLRHIVDDETLEDQKEKNMLYRFLNMDIAERLKIIKKLKQHKALTAEEKRIVLEVENEHRGKF